MFDSVSLAPADPILGLTEAFKADDRASKVNLGVGVYLDENGQLPLMQCIKVAANQVNEAAQPYGYLPIDGLPEYNQAVKELVFGADSEAVHSGRVVTVQALGGTGALKLGADFMRGVIPAATVLISDPSWDNHRGVFSKAGFAVENYRYYNAATRSVDLEGMLEDLRSAPPKSIVVLHACCHNPTGYDLSDEQWDQVLAVLEERGHVPFVDMAYQGFAEGIERDGALIRKLAEGGWQFLAATSFSKSMGLYGQRVGALHAVTSSSEVAKRVLSQLKICARVNFSNPPTFGAKLAAAVLTQPELRAQWDEELTQMRLRIADVRRQLVAGLRAAGIDDMDFIAEQRGMFSYSGLSKDEMQALRSKHAIYGTDAGRICVAGINQSNLQQVIEAISAVRR